LVASESPDIAQPQWLIYFLRLSFAVAAQAPEGGVSLVEQVAESHNCAIYSSGDAFLGFILLLNRPSGWIRL
tara:strand:+ start:24303 stop:24518 length:216 start_codon:yes stop_codon:yes gene_type:complete